MTIIEATDRAALDTAVADLRASAPAWVALPLAEKIALLERLRPRIADAAEEMVAATQRAKGIDPGTTWGAEDWLSTPWAFLQGVTSLLEILRRIDRGEPPIPLNRARTRPDGRTVVEVFPFTGMDRLLFSGYEAQVWMQDGISPEQAVARAAAVYRGRGYPDPGVTLVLAAGNVGTIATLDFLHVLYGEGSVAVVKMNQVNDYLSPFFASIFAEFVDQGWLRFVHGGADVGSYLAFHDDVDSVHMTGSAATHDAIVWGTDGGAEERKAAGAPLLTKRITSELGGVSPLIVVPGRWTQADIRFQAEHIVTSKLNNAGHNCIGTQVLVVPDAWPLTDALLAEVRTVIRELPPRRAYYPRTDERVARAIDGRAAEDLVSCQLLDGIDADVEDAFLRDEVFGPALGVVRLPATTVTDFLDAAVDFANDALPGTLGATLVIDPETEKRYAPAFDAALDRLRYGAIGVNAWSALAFLLVYTPWGAYPGHTLDDIGSGIGLVHNSVMLDGVLKSVSRMPFRPMHRSILRGHVHTSPKPPFFVTAKTGEATARKLVEYLGYGRTSAVPALFASALRA